MMDDKWKTNTARFRFEGVVGPTQSCATIAKHVRYQREGFPSPYTTRGTSLHRVGFLQTRHRAGWVDCLSLNVDGIAGTIILHL